MTEAREPSLKGLNDCGCCEGVGVQTPIEVYNRPGLSAIAYRVGIHAQFKQSLLASLADAELPALNDLTTRADDDFAIALLDAWATVADVLTFYQERIANESYLRTATERLSLLQLARLIGYELRPGVAASTYLAFTLEDTPGSPGKATIDIGTKVQSVPNPGQQPQTFETVEKIEAWAEWNAIKPRLTQRHPIKRDMDRLYFEGIATGLKPGDGLLTITDEGQEPIFRQVAEVILQATQQRTEVKLQGLATISPPSTPLARFADRLAVAEIRSGISAVTSKYLQQNTVSTIDLLATARTQKFSLSEVFANLKATQPPPPSVNVFRMRAAIFGHNALKWESLPNTLRFGEYIYIPRQPTPEDARTQEIVYQKGFLSDRQNSWAESTLDEYDRYDNNQNQPDPARRTRTSKYIYLDNAYPSIVKDSWVVLKDGIQPIPYRVQEVTELSKSDFTFSAKVTRLELNSRNSFDKFKIRTTTVFAQSEELKLARLPIETAISGTTIDLESSIEDLFVGQSIIICGELHQNRGNHACELVAIAAVNYIFLDNEGFTQIELRTKLSNDYVRNTVTIHANVANATHGETVQEVLGSGNASQSYQSFALRQPPLTYVSAATSSGTASTLQVRVNDLLWHEVPTLYGRSAQERVFVTRTSDDAKTTIEFGSRLPTGQENVKATYRKGIGLGGLVKANQLSLLMTRPLGVKGVTNPQDATGAEDPESLEQARRNATLTVLTLDRIVSLQDYEDFAGAFAGIAKALATWTWNGQQRGVLVTVAGPNQAEVKSDSDLYKNLISAMQQAGDHYVPLQVKSYLPAFFRLQAKVKIDPDYIPAKVLATVRQSLQTQFSFDVRNFGQGVALSEAIAVMQAVPGVVAVDVDTFYRFGQVADLQPRLTAAAPQPGAAATVAAAELLTIDPNSPPDDLGVIV